MSAHETAMEKYLRKIFPEGCDSSDGCPFPRCLLAGCPGPSLDCIDETKLEGYEPPSRLRVSPPANEQPKSEDDR